MKFDSVDIPILQNSGNPFEVRHLVRRQYGFGASELAPHKLRARYLSFRRIAEPLSVHCDVVARWVAGLPDTNDTPAELSPFVHPAIALPVERKPTAAPFNAAHISVLGRRLLEAFASFQRLSDEGWRRTARLMNTRSEKRQLARLKIDRLAAKVATRRTALGALSSADNGTQVSTESATSASSRRLLRWGTKI
jgi:hypothetical protein